MPQIGSPFTRLISVRSVVQIHPGPWLVMPMTLNFGRPGDDGFTLLPDMPADPVFARRLEGVVQVPAHLPDPVRLPPSLLASRTAKKSKPSVRGAVCGRFRPQLRPRR